VYAEVSETYDIYPNLVRLAMIFLCFATAILPVVLTYLIAWVILPEEPTV
jgi:phage shock protein PspC (stress-responsive transcriptional regulator)